VTSVAAPVLRRVFLTPDGVRQPPKQVAHIGHLIRPEASILGSVRATITVQTEPPPYKYVMVEGPVVVLPEQRDDYAMASRLPGPKLGSGTPRAIRARP
jgi:hypothetical protein